MPSVHRLCKSPVRLGNVPARLRGQSENRHLKREKRVEGGVEGGDGGEGEGGRG